MAGVALILDLLKKNPTKTFQASSFFSSAAAASAAAASISFSTPFASSFLFRHSKTPVAYCDAGIPGIGFPDDYITKIRRASEDIFQRHSLDYITTKEYNIQLKPLFSAFEIRALAMTSLRSFLLYYLPLIEPKTLTEDDDEDFLQDTEERNLDLVVPFKKSVKQIIRETTIVTTRRVLERLAVHYVSQRMAWKLLKDVPKSAVRKAERGMPTVVYIYGVGKTTFRGYLLGVAAAWLVQVGIEVYRCFSRIIKTEEEIEEVENFEQVKLMGKNISAVTFRCGASLIFASIGGGVGAVLIRPSLGQWIGCAIGDLAGPFIATACLEKLLH